MADIFDVDNQENYDIPMSHEPSEEDYLASFEDKTLKADIVYPGGIHPSIKKAHAIDDKDFYDMMAQQTWIPEQVEKAGAIKDEHGILDFGKMQEQINMDRHQLEMWGKLSTATDPSHYNSVPADLQHWDVVERMGWGYHVGCATKYIWRAGKKASAAMTIEQKEIEDLEKAMVYLQKRIDLIKGDKS